MGPEARVDHGDVLGREVPLYHNRHVIELKGAFAQTSREHHRCTANLRGEQVVDVPTLLIVADDERRHLARLLHDKVSRVAEMIRRQRDRCRTTIGSINQDALPAGLARTRDVQVRAGRIDGCEEPFNLKVVVTSASDEIAIRTTRWIDIYVKRSSRVRVGDRGDRTVGHVLRGNGRVVENVQRHAVTHDVPNGTIALIASQSERAVHDERVGIRDALNEAKLTRTITDGLTAHVESKTRDGVLKGKRKRFLEGTGRVARCGHRWSRNLEESVNELCRDFCQLGLIYLRVSERTLIGTSVDTLIDPEANREDALTATQVKRLRDTLKERSGCIECILNRVHDGAILEDGIESGQVCLCCSHTWLILCGLELGPEF